MPVYASLVADAVTLTKATANLNVHEAGEPPIVSLRFDGSHFTIQSHDMDPSEFLTAMRRLCDDAERQWHVWLDENADTYMLDADTHLYACCDGYFEHTDGCAVRAQIDAARRALMHAEPVDDSHVEDGPAGFRIRRPDEDSPLATVHIGNVVALTTTTTSRHNGAGYSGPVTDIDCEHIRLDATNVDGPRDRIVLLEDVAEISIVALDAQVPA